MSDSATHAALIGLRTRLRELELDAVAIKSRIEEIHDLIGLLEHGARRKQRKITVVNLPQHDEPDPAA